MTYDETMNINEKQAEWLLGPEVNRLLHYARRGGKGFSIRMNSETRRRWRGGRFGVLRRGLYRACARWMA